MIMETRFFWSTEMSETASVSIVFINRAYRTNEYILTLQTFNISIRDC